MTVKPHISKKTTRSPTVAPTMKSRLPDKKNISKIAGCLSNEDAAELKAIIQQGCEVIDRGERRGKWGRWYDARLSG